MKLTVERHPCFNKDARHKHGRIHLPVAPKCNIQCKFCNRKYDCPSESRPGVTSNVLSPAQSIWFLDKVMDREPNISVVGIAGPGDPFANAEETIETFRLVRQKYPEMLLCVASNGLEVEPWVDQLAELNTSHVSLTVNASDPAIGAGVYRWVRYNKRVYRGEGAGRVLLEQQIKAIGALKARDIIVKINTIVIPGVNDEHVLDVSRMVAELGCDIQNCMPLYPVEETEFGDLPEPAAEMMAELRAQAGQIIPQMSHCSRCRADAAGLIGKGLSAELTEALRQSAAQPIDPSEDRPYVAVASQEGFLVNQHLGEAERLLIFSREGNSFKRVESRAAPPVGGGHSRWMQLGEILSDCRAVLVSGDGHSPRQVLGQSGCKVIVAEGLIDECLANIYAGRAVRSPARPFQCGASCAGDGLGCG